MTDIYDWIVVGAGFVGATLGYELSKQGFKVLLVEQYRHLQGATRYSYGGLSFWAGTTELTRQICHEGALIYTSLADELDGETQFREIDLLLTIAPGEAIHQIVSSYAQFATAPQLISATDAVELEPLLNRAAIAAALTVRHGHIDPERTTQAYLQAFHRQGGHTYQGQVTGLRRGSQMQVTGVVCGQTDLTAANVVICAGASSRSLLKAAGIPIRLYFTQAEIIETAPILDLQLRTMVSPADLKRYQLEDAASRLEMDALWDEPGHEPASPILDAGAIQLLDGRLRLGQLSRALTDLGSRPDAAKSEAMIREGVRQILPALADLPGTWHCCHVVYSADHLPLVGAVPGIEGVFLFTGFSSPLAIAPALARRFAAHASGNLDPLIESLSPRRFALAS